MWKVVVPAALPFVLNGVRVGVGVAWMTVVAAEYFGQFLGLGALRAGRQEGAVVALREVSLAVEAGELVCILGRSGCGKTSLLRIVSGLEEPTDGAVYLEGTRIVGPGSGVGMVFQDPTLFPWRTVEANIALGLESLALNKAERAKIVADM